MSCKTRSQVPAVSREADRGGGPTRRKEAPAVAASDNGIARSHGREADVTVVLWWAGFLRGRLLHASSGSTEGNPPLLCAG